MALLCHNNGVWDLCWPHGVVVELAFSLASSARNNHWSRGASEPPTSAWCHQTLQLHSKQILLPLDSAALCYLLNRSINGKRVRWALAKDSLLLGATATSCRWQPPIDIIIPIIHWFTSSREKSCRTKRVCVIIMLSRTHCNSESNYSVEQAANCHPLATTISVDLPLSASFQIEWNWIGLDWSRVGF